MIPSATNAYIKCDMRPSEDHVHRNDKKSMAWCQRHQATPRATSTKINGSNRVWDCMTYEYQTPPDVANISTQCSALNSESAAATPPQARRSVLTSVQSEPQIRRAPRETSRFAHLATGYQEDRIPSYARDPLVTLATENVPPVQLQLRQPLDSMSDCGRESIISAFLDRNSTPRGGTTPRGVETPRAGPPRGSRTPRSVTPRGTRTPRSATPRGGNVTPRGGDVTPRGGTRTPRSTTPRSTTPRGMQHSGSEALLGPAKAWR